MGENLEKSLVRPEVMEFIEKYFQKNIDSCGTTWVGGHQVISGQDMLDYIRLYSDGKPTPLGKKFYEIAEELYDELKKR